MVWTTRRGRDRYPRSQKRLNERRKKPNGLEETEETLKPEIPLHRGFEEPLLSHATIELE